MSSRLVFQEGKRIDGEHYIASIYEEVHLRTYRVVVFNLESGNAYNTSISFSQFEELFKYRGSLLSPWSFDARFHFLVERLDLMPGEDIKDTRLFVSIDPTIDSNTVNDDSMENSGTARGECTRIEFLNKLSARREIEDLLSRVRAGRLDIIRRNSLHLRESYIPKSRDHKENIMFQFSNKRHSSQSNTSSNLKSPSSSRKTFTKSSVAPSVSRVENPERMSISQLLFSSGEHEFNEYLKLLSTDTRQARAKHLELSEARKKELFDSKHARWISYQEVSVERFNQKRILRDIQMQIEVRRSTKIHARCRERMVIYGKEIIEKRIVNRLECKHLQNRIREARCRLIREHHEVLISQTALRRNAAKLELVRNRNIEIKLEIRDRRLKELKWKKERTNPSFKVSSNESVKSFKSSTSLSANHLAQQQQEEKDRQEFLVKLEQQEKVRSRIKAHEAPATITETKSQAEVRRYREWKLEQSCKRENLLVTKAKLVEKRRECLKSETTDRQLELTRYMQLEEHRDRLIRERCYLVARVVKEKASSNVRFADEIVPCLMLE